MKVNNFIYMSCKFSVNDMIFCSIKVITCNISIDFFYC